MKLKFIYILYLFLKTKKLLLYWGLGIGVWGLGIGDWGLGPFPNPQSPIPNPHPHFLILNFKIKITILYYKKN